jgi:hypothetical protein
LVEGEISTPRGIVAWVSQGSVLAPVLYGLHINDALAAPETHLVLFATEKHERRVLCKLQRGFTAANSWCERCNIKNNEGKTQAIYFSDGLESLRMYYSLKRRDILFVNIVTYLGVTFNNRMTWSHHIERTVAKASNTYIKAYFLFKTGRLKN